jgi:ABC-2 type transport system ATP-binding protein
VVGYMPEGDCLLPGMSGVELVSTLGRITGLSRQDAMTRAHEVLDYVELDEERYRMLDEYSTGMKQRLKLAQTLVHDPDILLLDEPTNGLDPKGRRHMLELVHDLGHAQGKNILLCSHLLPDVEQTCDHVVVLDRGRLCTSGAIEAMTASDGVQMAVTLGDPWEPLARRFAAEGFECEGEGRELRLRLPQNVRDADHLFVLAAEEGVTITGLREVRSSLQDVFLEALGLPRTQMAALERPESPGA